MVVHTTANPRAWVVANRRRVRLRLGCRARPGVSTKPKQQRPIASHLQEDIFVARWWEIRFSFKKSIRRKDVGQRKPFLVSMWRGNEISHPLCGAYKAPVKQEHTVQRNNSNTLMIKHLK